MSRVAVIDIGSNSIKCLVATRDDQNRLIPVSEKTLPVRISKGISTTQPMLSPESIQAGLQAVQELLQFCREYNPITTTRIVATSAVRDAQNKEEFINALRQIKAPDLTILSGIEEATWIAQGILEDPSLPNDTRNATIIDLGGGSLEIIALHDRKIAHKTSLPLGAVRLTETFRPIPQNPLTDREIQAIKEETETQWKQSGVPLTQPLLATGGMVTTWRAMTKPDTLKLTSISPLLERATLLHWIEALKEMSWEKRLSIPGLPPSRADIFPTGIIILDTLMDLAEADSLTHSLYNLRYGLASHLLSEE